MTYDFHTYRQELFNPLIYRLQDAETRFVLNYGGAGSGKSYSQTQHEIMNALQRKQRILVIRKVGKTLPDSVVSLFESILKQWGVPYNYNKSERIITFADTQSQILFRGLDDPEKIKSIAGIRRIWIEEASELTLEDFNQLNLRLRGAENLQITLTFNPIDELHWIKKTFFDVEKDNSTVIHTTYLDNKFLDEDYRKELEGYKQHDYNYYRVYALGEWGKTDTGAEFYKAFDPYTNTGSGGVYNVDLDLPLLISFDENVNPYMPANIWQLKDRKLVCIDEVICKPPYNSIEYMCTQIAKRVELWHHDAGMVIFGDATSRKKDVKIEQGYNLFSLIQKHLAQYRPKLKVPNANPSVMMRGLFINDIFAGRQDVEILVHEKCKYTIEDVKYTKEAPDGTKHKEMVTDPKTKVRHQQYGHLSDAMDYIVCEIFKTEYRAFQRHDTSKKRVALKTVDRVGY